MRVSAVLGSIIVLSMLLQVFSCLSSTVLALPAAALLPPFHDYGQDTDLDGLYEYLVIDVTIEVYQAGNYMVSVFLNDSAGSPIASVGMGGTYDVGTHVVSVPLEGIKIWAHGVNGPYVVHVQLNSYPWTLIDEFVDATGPYTYDQFEPLPALFAAVSGASGLDTDGNGRFEFLVTDFSVEVVEAKVYSFTCDLLKLVSSSWVYLEETNESRYLGVGAQELSIAFRGSRINAAELDGPYYVLLSLYDSVGGRRYLDDIWYMTDSFGYAQFEAGSLTSRWSQLSPEIDGLFGPHEWQDATAVALDSPDKGNPFNTTMLVKNDPTHLYICLDAVGDESNDTADSSAIAFDTGNDNTAIAGREDQFIIGPAPRQSVHNVYSSAASDWVVDCEPFDSTLRNHTGLAAAVGFGASTGSETDHRIYEFAIPLSLICVDPGGVIGFATNSNYSLGVFDASLNNGSSWPFFMDAHAPLADYGDLTIGLPPIHTAVAISGTLGNEGWYISPVNLTLAASGGLLGISRTEYKLDLGSWGNYYSPVGCDEEGLHKLSYKSYDLKGNSELPRYLDFAIDLTAPSTASSLTGRNVTLNATDTTSGVYKTHFRVDGGPWQNYTGPIEVSGDAKHTVEFYSVDVAGNTEEMKALDVKKMNDVGGGGIELPGYTLWIVLAVLATLISVSVLRMFVMRRKTK